MHPDLCNVARLSLSLSLFCCDRGRKQIADNLNLGLWRSLRYRRLQQGIRRWLGRLPSLKAKAKRKADSEMEGLKALPARRRFKFQPVTVIFSTVTSTVGAITRHIALGPNRFHFNLSAPVRCAKYMAGGGNEIRLLFNLH
ncbi:hypothetical protein FIBSPDRAFT_925072 [Athelia psychrophila]|uniref:Uncharacterized protein n=1 Tax=Athelia psychrophila TaxID=1759441 RepID=A0A166VCE3_9AGAM|nr:hypothetical protein FIBSPDRAFT_925072 [Fibularhizoctonia sp. CBS 109695]